MTIYVCIHIHLKTVHNQHMFLPLAKQCNHKRLGIYCLLSAFISGNSSALISLIRMEFYSSGNRIISKEKKKFYKRRITLHGFLMIVVLVMLGLFGGFGFFCTYLSSVSVSGISQSGSFFYLDSFTLYLFVIFSLISEFGDGTGWTFYPPFTMSFMTLSPSSTAYPTFGWLMSGLSSCLTFLNFWTTSLNPISYYLTLKTMPLFPWALLLTGGMPSLTLPI